MPVLRPSRTAVLAALASLAVAGAARAEPVVLSFEQSIYTDGAAKERALSVPEGVACSEGGDLVVVADTGNHRLVTFAMKDGRMSGGAEVKLAQLTSPVRVQVDAKRNVLALDGKTHRIVRVDPKGALAGTVELKGAAAPAVLVVGFKVDASDNLYVLDAAGRRVLFADPAGTVTRQVELPKEGTFTDVAVDPAGTLYAIDAIGATLWSVERGGAAFRPLAKGMKDRMNFPVSLAVSRGRLFLADQHGNGIVVLGIDGSFQGRQLSIGWNEGLVYYPTQLCVTEAGAVVVADRSNNRVQLFALAR
jgi:DNA-binding beta-propeller fold protein YncE